jgi:hypothetical protein
MINLVFAVYDKGGNLLLGPVDTGSLWAGFAIPDCTDPSGDPVVLYDQFMDRWLLSQFTTAGPEFFNCVAISTTSDPTGSYYRYAFSTGPNFPDYPKYGNWTDSYVITTREFGPTIEYGIGVYALEKNKMVNGDPNARNVRFFIDGNDPDLLPLVGDVCCQQTPMVNRSRKQTRRFRSSERKTTMPLTVRPSTRSTSGIYSLNGDQPPSRRWCSTHNFPQRRLTQCFRARLPHVTACRNLAFRSAMRGIWTFYPTGSGRPSAWRTGTSKPTKRS